jgi:hypothetical protein
MEKPATRAFWRAVVTALMLLGVVGPGTASTPREDDDNDDDQPARPVTIGVIGDMPYTSQQLAAFQGFLNAMSVDPAFRLAIHLGDIKSGGSACTDAYIKGVRDAVNSYGGAFVYTPGDNEWTDCHRNAGDPRNPAERLRFLRAKFFYRPGATLGLRPRRVLTQASDPRFPAFVENQAWIDGHAVFAVVNLPGSNNDLDPWTNGVGTAAEQQQEFDTRLAADLDWLDQVFDLADESHARAVVLGIQADMWDPAAGAAELTGYDQIVQKLAALILRFGRPVLLLNGDSHEFVVDNPLANGDPAHGVTTPVPNLTRIVVQGGAGHFPLEYVKVRIDTRQKRAPFSWERVTPTLAP